MQTHHFPELWIRNSIDIETDMLIKISYGYQAQRRLKYRTEKILKRRAQKQCMDACRTADMASLHDAVQAALEAMMISINGGNRRTVTVMVGGIWVYKIPKGSRRKGSVRSCLKVSGRRGAKKFE